MANLSPANAMFGPRPKPSSTTATELSPLFSRFIQTRNSPKTKKTYNQAIAYALGENPDTWIKADRSKIENHLIDFILQTKIRVSSATLRNYVIPVKSFLEFYDVTLSWKKIRSVMGPIKRIASDRPPTVQEVKKLLTFADLRLRTIVLILISSGARMGAFYFPISQGGRDSEFPLTQKKGWGYLRLKDMEFNPSGLTKVRVYPGEMEEYQTFISVEATQALQEYLDARKRIGEELKPESPVIRDVWTYTNNGKIYPSIRPEIATPLTEKGIASLIDRYWRISGAKVSSRNRGFKAAHGFRKYFKTQAAKGIGKAEIVECLMGHKLAYFKPTLEELETDYLKALPYITILRSEEEIRGEFERAYESNYQELRADFEEFKRGVSEVIVGMARKNPPDGGIRTIHFSADKALVLDGPKAGNFLNESELEHLRDEEPKAPKANHARRTDQHGV